MLVHLVYLKDELNEEVEVDIWAHTVLQYKEGSSPLTYHQWLLLSTKTFLKKNLDQVILCF